MKKLLVAIIAPLLTMGLLLDASAQAPRPSTGGSADPSASPSSRQTWQNTQRAQESADLIGSDVMNAEGKDVGDIELLMIDPASGQVTHVVIGMGGAAAGPESKVVLPYSDIKVNPQQTGGKMSVSTDQSKLDKAPRYDKRAAAGGSAPPAASPGTSPTPGTTPTPGTK